MKMITASYERNYAKNGIEISFSEMPPLNVRKDLLSHGWRYMNTGRYWYHYYSLNNIKYAGMICAKYKSVTEKTQSAVKVDKTAVKKTQTSRKAEKPCANIYYVRPSFYSCRPNDISDNISPVTPTKDEYGPLKYAEVTQRPLGQYMFISPNDPRYKRKRSLYS